MTTAMGKKTTATIARNAKTGTFTVRQNGGATTVYKVTQKSSDAIRKSATTYRDALKRLADK